MLEEVSRVSCDLYPLPEVQLTVVLRAMSPRAGFPWVAKVLLDYADVVHRAGRWGPMGSRKIA